ncbi:MAG TPA: hydroxymethylbilane synthase [Stellaceae bacterium]|nr:hydroxymethylbilane synthase [Stellaceae bacterium]
MAPVLRLGTRGSPLALAQAHQAVARLAAAHVELAAPGAIEIVPVRTSGDRITDRPLADIGGKALFTKEIEEALLDRRIDLAVHSLKDMETVLPQGLEIACCLPREDPRDALVALGSARRIADLAPGAVVGTSSVRRKAQLLAARPDLEIVPMRGNVGTRLQKLAAGECTATVLAAAGLNRLGRTDAAAALLDPADMLPAAGQGIIAIEARETDLRVRELLAAIDDEAASRAAAAERAVLAALGGTCRTPIAALATIAGSRLAIEAMVIELDGSAIWRAAREGPVIYMRAMGEDAGADLRARVRPGLIA